MMIGITLNGPALLDLTVNDRSTVSEGYPPGNLAQWPGYCPMVDGEMKLDSGLCRNDGPGIMLRPHIFEHRL